MMMVEQRLFKLGETVGLVDLSRLFGPLEVPMPKFWCVLHVHAGREFKVMKTFRQRNISGWLPLQTTTQNVTRYRRGYEYVQRQQVTSPLITGAIIIPDFEMELQRWRDVDGVIGIYRMGECVPMLTPQHMAELRNIEAIGNTPKSKRERAFQVGTLVRVKHGPFALFCGRVERFDSVGRLSVGVDIFGRVTPVELDEGDIEKV